MDVRSIPRSGKDEGHEGAARPLAYYHPTVWGEFFVQDEHLLMPSENLQIDHISQMQQRVEMLKEQVRTMFSTALDEEMKLVDALQRLGLAYHFEKEISEALARIHASDQYSTVAASEDLRAVSLQFRLLRRGGYNVSSNEFNKFKDVHGHFKRSLSSDIEGLLSLYEASNCLGTREEDDILEEAMSFCRRELESMLDRLQPPLAAEVVRALGMPLVKRIQRLEAREYISFYEATEGRDDVILELAKLDFNRLQALYQGEVRVLTRWWKELGLIEKLNFARDRLVECYVWVLAVKYEPHLAHVRMMMTKVICLVSVLDDIYDSYGTSEELRLLTDVMQSYHPIPMVFSQAKGTSVWDPEGNKYIDFLSAYSAVNQGHCHPRVMEALVEQAGRLTLSSRAFFNDKFPVFAELLTRMFGYDMVLPMNTGAEGVETALKLARKWGYEKKNIPNDEAIIVSCCGCFHGRTLGVISMSCDNDAACGFGPLLPGHMKIDFGDIEGLEKLFREHGNKIAAFLFEPIQGEAGVILPPDGYLKAVRDLCSRYNVLMVADEIQTGIGRTGKMLACDWEEIRPDVVILGKALGAGVLPVSAVLADKDIMLCIKPGEHGSTFGGNPLASAVAIASLNVIKDEGLVDRRFFTGFLSGISITREHFCRLTTKHS